MSDDLKSLIALVASMRYAQRLYFQTRSPQALDEARKLERAVDKRLTELADSEQRKMF